MDCTANQAGNFGEQPRADDMPAAFAAFVLAHASCEGEVLESRLDEDTVVCGCMRCGEVELFGSARQAARVGPGGGRRSCREGQVRDAKD